MKNSLLLIAILTIAGHQVFASGSDHETRFKNKRINREKAQIIKLLEKGRVAPTLVAELPMTKGLYSGSENGDPKSKRHFKKNVYFFGSEGTSCETSWVFEMSSVDRDSSPMPGPDREKVYFLQVECTDQNDKSMEPVLRIKERR